MVNNSNSAANIPTSKTNVYLLGEKQLQTEKMALYLGRSYSNDEDWFCIGKIIINGKEVFKCDSPSYSPDFIEDDQIASQAIGYAISSRADQIVHEYFEIEKAIKKLTIIDSLFRKKEVSELRKKFNKLQSEYENIKAIRDNASLLKLICEHKISPSSGPSGNRPSQPGEY